MKTLGIILVVLGLLGMAWPTITYVRREKIFEAGPVQIAVKKHETISLAPFMGLMSLAGGAALIIAAVITKK